MTSTIKVEIPQHLTNALHSWSFNGNLTVKLTRGCTAFCNNPLYRVSTVLSIGIFYMFVPFHGDSGQTNRKFSPPIIDLRGCQCQLISHKGDIVTEELTTITKPSLMPCARVTFEVALQARCYHSVQRLRHRLPQIMR